MRQRNTALNENRRKAILESASTCFVKSGFHGTSMKDVCLAAGMSPGTLYHYFRSKTEIIAGIIADETEMTLVLLSSLTTSQDFLEALFKLLDVIAKEVTELELALHTEIAAEVLRHSHLREVRQELDQRSLVIVKEAIIKAQNAGQIDKSLEAGKTAKLILALVDGLLWRATLEGPKSLQDYLPLAKQTLKRLLLSPSVNS